MSRIYKIEAYIVDVNESYYDAEDCFDALMEYSDCFSPTPINFKQADFEWDDDLMINNSRCTIDDCEAMFKEEK